jgi:hypothetical protein
MAKTWKSTVQNSYTSLEELKAYDEMYNVAERCGYSDCESFWNENPMIGGSVNPAGFGLVKVKKSVKKDTLKSYKLTGIFRKQSSIGNFENFKVDSIGSNPKDTMEKIREGMYSDGYDHILFQHVYLNGVEIPMMKALELE